MAKKKEPAKPLFAVKHEFYESLDNLAQQAINLLQVCEQLIDLEQVADPGKKILQERIASFRTALLSDG